MKRSLLLFIITLASVISASQSFAQNTADTILARIIYTNSERTAILAKTVGVAKVDTLFASKGTVAVKNISVLASTKDGNSLMIGCKFVYTNTLQSLDSGWVIGRLDAPFKNTGSINPFPTLTIGGVKLLKYFNVEEDLAIFHFVQTKMLPLGVLTPNESEWYATLSKVSPGSGNQWFFHGRFDGTGTVDSILVSGDAAAIAGYHMSNLATSDDGQTMLAFVFDQCMLSDKPRAQLFRWKPTTSGGGQPFLADQIQTVPNFRLGGNIDTCFAFLFRVIPNQTNPTAEIALAPNAQGDISLYSFRYNAGSSIALALPSTPRTLTRSNLPNSLHFFTGITGSPATATDDKEVITPQEGAPNGNGGDMMFSSTGDSVVFVTCRGDDYATNPESGIYIYDLNNDNVTLVENDPLKMERQPIFTKSIVHKYVAPPPPPYQVGRAAINKTNIDFGTLTIGNQNNTTVKVTDTTGSLVKITSAMIVGPDAGIFTVTSSPSVPATIIGHASMTFTVSFTPSAAKTYFDTLVIHYQDSLQKGEKDSIFIVPMTGIGASGTGVATSSPTSFDISVVPNPFTSLTSITVTAREEASTSIEIRDLLGKDMYSSKALKLAAGEKFTYTLDANALRLAPGTYFVIVRSGGEETTRQVIYIK